MSTPRVTSHERQGEDSPKTNQRKLRIARTVTRYNLGLASSVAAPSFSSRAFASRFPTPFSAATFASSLGTRACLSVLPVVDRLAAHTEELPKVLSGEPKAFPLYM